MEDSAAQKIAGAPRCGSRGKVTEAWCSVDDKFMKDSCWSTVKNSITVLAETVPFEI